MSTSRRQSIRGAAAGAACIAAPWYVRAQTQRALVFQGGIVLPVEELSFDLLDRFAQPMLHRHFGTYRASGEREEEQGGNREQQGLWK